MLLTGALWYCPLVWSKGLFFLIFVRVLKFEGERSDIALLSESVQAWRGCLSRMGGWGGISPCGEVSWGDGVSRWEIGCSGKRFLYLNVNGGWGVWLSLAGGFVCMGTWAGRQWVGSLKFFEFCRFGGILWGGCLFVVGHWAFWIGWDINLINKLLA